MSKNVKRVIAASCRRALPVVMASASILLTPNGAWSAGFLNEIQSAGAGSVSGAGETALAEDSSTVYYNPAGMVLLNDPELLSASGFIFPSGSFTDRGTVDAAGLPTQGSSGVSNRPLFVPSVFATVPVSDRFSLGIGVFMPFGQSQRYDGDWVGRYFLTSTSLISVDIDPAVALRVTDNLSVGGGVDVQNARFMRTNAIDFGSLCFGVLGPSSCLGLGLRPEGADGRLAVTGSDWAVGYNLGAVYQFRESTRVGLSFRSSVRHNFAGDARFTVPPSAAPLTEGGLLFQDTSAHAAITFPEILSFGISQKLGSDLTLLAGFNRTFWGSIKNLTLDFGNPLQPAEGLILNWHDSDRFAIGGIYALSGATDLRAGIAYDESPVPNGFRPPDIPDSNAIVVSAGFIHRFSERVSVGLSYTYSHSADAPLDLSNPEAGTIIGSYKLTSQSLGLQTLVQF